MPRSASTRQIRAAYVERARRAHPDLVGQRGLDPMRTINEAWDTLKDVERRAMFDTATGVPASAGGAHAASTLDADPNRPFWTGAMGPPPGRPWGPVLDFGIYAGWSLGEVSRHDRGYLMWLRDRPEAKGFRIEVAHLLDPDAGDPVDARRAARR